MKKKFYNKMTSLVMISLLIFSGMNLPLAAENMSESKSEITSTEEQNTDSEELKTAIETQSVSEEELTDTQESEMTDVSFTETAAPRVSTYGAGFATFDGVDLSGVTSVTYNQDNALAINANKAVKVNANFPAGEVTEKQVIIHVDSYLQFVAGNSAAPGMKMSGGTLLFDESLLPTHLKSAITGATFTKNNAKIPGYTNLSGTLVYTISDGVSALPLEFLVKLDPAFLINKDGLQFMNQVTVTTKADGVIVDEEVLEEYNYTTPHTPRGWQFENTQSYYADTSVVQTKATVFDTPVNMYGENKGQRVEALTVTYEYPKQLTFKQFVTSNIPQHKITSEIDVTQVDKNYITFTIADLQLSAQIRLEFDTDGTAQSGDTYTVKPKSQDTIIKPYNADAFIAPMKWGTFYITFIDAYSNAVNVGNYSYNASKQNDGNEDAQLGYISISNPQADPVFNQLFKLTFDDTVIGVRAFDLLTGTAKVTNIHGVTTKGNTFTMADITVKAERYNLSLVNSDIIPDSDEYIKEFYWEEEEIAKHWSSINASPSTRNTAAFYGKVLADAVHGSTGFSILETVPKEINDFASEQTKSAQLDTKITNAGTISMLVTATNLNMLSGQTQTMSGYVNFDGSLTANTATTNFASSIKGVNFYFREVDDIVLDMETFSITDNKGTEFSLAHNNVIVTEKVDNTGVKFYQVTMPDFVINLLHGSKPGDSTNRIQYNIDVMVKKTAKSFNLSNNTWMLAEPMNTKITIRGNQMLYLAKNQYGLSERAANANLFAANAATSIINQANIDFNVTTAANLNDGDWVSYDKITNKTIIDLNPEGEAKYKLEIANTSGQPANGYKAIIPIPKAGENTGLSILQDADFGWDVLLNEPVDISNTNYTYTIKYATSYETKFNAATWKDWNDIADKTQIRAIKLETTDTINSTESATDTNLGVDEIVFKIAMDPLTADAQAGAINIYSSLINRELGGVTADVASDPVAIRLKTGVIKGIVFNDTNYNGVQDPSEKGRNGVAVIAYETGTTTVIEQTTTKTIDGIDGAYAFLGLDKAQNVDITFMNPTNNDSVHFTAVTANGSTPTPTSAHDKATTANVVPSGLDFNTINAGFIVPVVIELKPQSANTADSTLNKYPGDIIVAAPTATRTGHDFTGWTLASNGGTSVSFPYTVTTSGATWYGQWSPKQYQVTYDIATNGGTGTAPATETVYFDTLVTAVADAVQLGHTFKGWYTESTGGTKWDFATSKMPNNDITLYAQFEKNVYDITWNLDNGTSTGMMPSTYATDTPTILLPIASTMSKTGYTFVEWQINGVVATDIPLGSTGDKVVTAIWNKDVYNITWNLNNGTSTGTMLATYSIDTPTIKLPSASTMTRLGYTFNKWQIDGVDGMDISLGSTGDKVVTAIWDKDVYNITWNLDNGTSTGTMPATYSIDTPTIILPAASTMSRTGYTFVEWQIDGVVAADIPLGSTGDKVVSAIWSQNDYTAAIQATNFTIDLTNVGTITGLEANATAEEIESNNGVTINTINEIANIVIDQTQLTDIQTTDIVGIYPLTYTVTTTHGETTTVTIQVYVSNEVAINNEIIMAHNFTLALKDVPTADFIALAQATGYDMTIIANPVGILVTEQTPRPTTAGKHPMRFETTKGGYAEIIVTVIDNIEKSVLNAHNATITLQELNATNTTETLKEIIIEKTEVEAYHETETGVQIIESKINVDLNGLDQVTTATQIEVTLSIDEPIETHSRNKLKTTKNTLAAETTVTITIVDDSDETISLPATGEHSIETIIITSIVMMVLLLIILRKKNQKV